MIQEQAPQVLKALNKVVLSGGRKVCVEIAGENTGKSDKSGKKKKVAAEKKADKPSKVEKAKKPSREERGYTSPRGPKRKMTGSSSFSRIINRFGEKNQTFQKKVGLNAANVKINKKPEGNCSFPAFYLFEDAFCCHLYTFDTSVFLVKSGSIQMDLLNPQPSVFMLPLW